MSDMPSNRHGDRDPPTRSARRWHVWAFAATPLIAVAITLGFHALPADIDTRATYLGGSWLIQEGDDPAFAEPDHDDSGWRRIEFPGGYTRQGFSARVSWVRKRFQAPILAPLETGYLLLGDTRGGFARVFLNGAFIGAQGVPGNHFKRDLIGLYGWEFDSRSLRGDGTDVVAIQLTFGSPGLDGIHDARMFIGSAEVLKRYRMQNRALRDTIEYGGLMACILGMGLIAALWLLIGDRPRRYRATLFMLGSCAFYLMCKTGLFLTFWTDPGATYNMVFVSLTFLGFGLCEFADEYCHGRTTIVRQINRFVCLTAMAIGVLVPVDITHIGLQLFGGYLALIDCVVLVMAVRIAMAGTHRLAPLLLAALLFMLFFGVNDVLVDRHVVAMPRLLPLGIANAAVMGCAVVVGEFLAGASTVLARQQLVARS